MKLDDKVRRLILSNCQKTFLCAKPRSQLSDHLEMGFDGAASLTLVLSHACEEMYAHSQNKHPNTPNRNIQIESNVKKSSQFNQ